MTRKVVRDLLGAPLRSASIVAALTLGITGFFAVLQSYAILTRALDEGYRASSPAAARLSVESLDVASLRAVEAVPGVLAAEQRRSVRGRVKAGPADWKNLVLFVRPDFERTQIDRLTREAGAWPGGPEGLAIERDALQVAHAQLGDDVEIRIEASPARKLRITGVVHDVGQAQARMENIVYGYVTAEVLAGLGVQPTWNELVLAVRAEPMTEAGVRTTVTAVRAVLEAQGHTVTHVDVPVPGRHPHSELMGLLMLAIAMFGFFILLLSGVLVFNVLSALLSGQRRQIGVMKALGGSVAQIARIYLLEALVLGGAAVVAALPLGVVAGRAICRTMAVFLNFDVVRFDVPLWVYMLVLLAGLVVPVGAALLPVWRGTRVPVHEALAERAFDARPYGTSPIDRARARLGGTNRLALLALRNATRNRLRSALTVVTLALGGLFFMSALGVKQSLVRAVDRYYAASRSDLSISLASDTALDRVEQAVQRVPDVVTMEGWVVVDGSLAGQDPAHRRNRLSVIGLPAQSAMMTFDVTAGDAQPSSGDGVVLNSALHDRLGRPLVGALVRLTVGRQEEQFRVEGVVREPFAQPVAYVARAFFAERSKQGTTNTLQVTLADPARAEVAKATLEAALEAEGVRIVRAQTKAESRLSFDLHMVMIYVFLLIVSVILAAVGTLGLFTTVSLNVGERRRELAVLRAIGATPAQVARLVVFEGVAVGLVAWAIAALTVVPVTWAAGNLLLRAMLGSGAELPMGFEAMGPAIWFVIAVLGSAIAAGGPAWRASKTVVRDALAYE